MERLTLRLRPRSPFGTPLMGDTLFGQLCWALRDRHGEAQLVDLLDGYTDGRPFAVISDAMPAGYLPRPALPLERVGEVDPRLRKQLKRRRWLPAESLAEPATWLERLAEVTDARPRPQPHNSISRATGTTGTGAFAPYTMVQLWHASGSELDCHVCLDTERLPKADLLGLFADMGQTGFGRDASIGLGRFEVREAAPMPAPTMPGGAARLTLGPLAPQGLDLDPARSYYEVFTRFGRHGAAGVHLGNPFKTPVLMLRAGAVLAPQQPDERPYLGQGLGGGGRLSLKIPGTVQQGYAPVLPIALS